MLPYVFTSPFITAPLCGELGLTSVGTDPLALSPLLSELLLVSSLAAAEPASDDECIGEASNGLLVMVEDSASLWMSRDTAVSETSSALCSSSSPSSSSSLPILDHTTNLYDTFTSRYIIHVFLDQLLSVLLSEA